jgi:hypothetical protein
MADKDGGLTEVKSIFTDTQGKQVFLENSILRGSEVVKTEIEEKQTGEKATIEVVDDQVIFTKVDAKGKTEIEKEKIKGKLVIPAVFNAYVKENWEALAKGDTLEFRFGVWARKETVGFKMFKISEQDDKGQKTFTLKMKPSSFIIAAIVKPLEFTYSNKGEKLISYKGRVAPKKDDGKGNFKDFDAEVVYAYEP